MSPVNRDVTQLLDAWSDGHREALDQLMPLVVDELRLLARRFLALEDPDHTLQPTALVNEVYLRLTGRRVVQWKNRAQFFGFAADLMRHILVDYARSRKSTKRGVWAARISLDEMLGLPEREVTDLIGLDDALKSLEALDPRQCEIVKLRYFTGLTIEETADVLGISPPTVKREWRTARLWLKRELGGG